MEPDSRSENYPPPPFIQPFECSQVSSQCYEDYSSPSESLQSAQPSPSSLSVVKPENFGQLSLAALPPPPATPCPPAQLLSDSNSAQTSVENPRLESLKKKANGSTITTTTEWLPPTPVDSDNSPSPPGENNKRKCVMAPRDGIVASLMDSDLWNNFSRVGNEMIVTKPGRRLFPTLVVGLRGLEAFVEYDIALKVASVDPYRYKFMNMKWVAVGESEVLQDEKRHFYRHPNSPKPGYFWMKKPISFKPCKITHDPHSKHGHIVLHTMHKYVLELQITALKTNKKPICIRLDATEFVAVSAYQNTNLTQLKIDNNPFAKGFRDREIVPASSYPAFHHPQYRHPSLDHSMPLPALPGIHKLGSESIASSATNSPMFSTPSLPSIPSLSSLPDYTKLPIDYARLPLLPPRGTDYTKPPGFPYSIAPGQSTGLPLIGGFSMAGPCDGSSMSNGGSPTLHVQNLP